MTIKVFFIIATCFCYKKTNAISACYLPLVLEHKEKVFWQTETFKVIEIFKGIGSEIESLTRKVCLLKKWNKKGKLTEPTNVPKHWEICQKSTTGLELFTILVHVKNLAKCPVLSFCLCSLLNPSLKS